MHNVQGSLTPLTPLLCVAIFLIGFSISVRRQGGRPPGPRQLPLIGNLFNFPRERRWEAFASWKKQYGNVVYLSVLGTPLLVLNSMDVCIDLLDKRSSKYSGRPRSVILTEYIGYDYVLPMMDYSPRWRRYRRVFHQHFNEKASFGYRPVQDRCVYQFLQRLLQEPTDFLDHLRLLFGETMLDLVYDIKIEGKDSIFIRAIERAVEAALEVTIPGRFLVEFFPAMKYLPSWFPGGTFKTFAAKRKQFVLDAKDMPFSHAKERMEAGTAGPSVLRSMLSQCRDTGEKPKSGETAEDIAKGCAAIAYLAGADTTLSTTQAFFLVIANRQDIQITARAELDALLGTSPNRLPTSEDEARLPFTAAITRELLRWHNVVPLGIPHVLTEDDEYNGWFIPKGTVVFANIWGVLHDPELYPEPFTFNPWRWLIETSEGLKPNPSVPDPRAAFGFGRRVCPGRHFAMHSLFTIVATVLTCFEVKPLDECGKPTDRIAEVFTDGLLSYPAPYKVSIKPRSDHFAKLIKDLAM